MTLNDYINAWAMDALATAIFNDEALEEEAYSSIQWEGLDWQVKDRSTGAEAGYAYAVPLDLWALALTDALAESPEGAELARAWAERAAEELTEARLYGR